MTVLEIYAQLGEAVVRLVTQYVENGVVCPTSQKKGLLTTSAIDNIDHNPTAATATTSFHGTSISKFKHPSSNNADGERGLLKVIADGKAKKVLELPKTFTNIPPDYIAKKPAPPTTPVLSLPSPESFTTH